MRALLLLLLVTACAAPDARSREGEDFARELAGRTAGPPQSCIPTDQGRSLRIVDDRTLAYDSGRTLWVNRLTAPCPGLRPMDTLIVEVNGSQYCRGDHVRSRPFPGNGIAGPICILGDFTPYRRAG
ncbi:MAG TPA: hypothetical protein VGD66_13975 [Allosphingosinicella sp.]|jgi:hypothetical protein